MLRAVLFSFVVSLSAFAEDSALVKAVDFWKVLPHTNSLVTTAWTQPDYDDSAWPIRQASFVTSYGNYIGAGEITVLPENVITYCFRKTFQIADPSFVKWLALRVDYESGFVAYLNGVEVVRRGFGPSTQPIPLGAPANEHARGPTEIIDVSDGVSALRAGTNVLAIQLHSAGPDLPSMLLVTELLANITRGPFLQNTTTNSVQIAWQTATPTVGSVVFGKNPDDLFSIPVELSDTNHVVTLTNLEPAQTYTYQIYVQDETQVAVSDPYTFRTFGMRGSPVTFLTFGDSGEGSLAQYNIANQLRSQPADLVMHLGDMVYFCFTLEHVDARFFSIYRDKLRNTPVFATEGNHESYCNFPAVFYSAFYFPTNSATGTEEWYSFDAGDVHFVVLDANTESGHRYDPASVQYKWLEADLAATTQRWKFIFFHHVIRSSSVHGFYDDLLGNGILDKYEIQSSIGALASRYGAQVVFNGHDHDFERFASYEGYNSFVCGGGGAFLYPQSFLEEGSAQFQMRHCFLKVTVEGPELKVEAIDEAGQIFDRFYRSQNASGPGPFASSWGSPMVEAANGSDVAGNIPGQTFNFSGASIPTRAGQRGNLGRLHVRNDRDFLYLGFESVSIWLNQVIAVFLENPNHPGITDLAPLGNTQLDSDSLGEGADGLDLLTNLTFRNFHPSVGCLLGDEKADGTSRNFKRDGMRWATGQGVFHLDQTFSTVTGARVQQFSRSPQTPVPQFHDENADFIEVAIPLFELANPQYPGSANQIKLGAIVFADPASGPILPQIDTAVAGAALDPGEAGAFTLEPLTIQLAPDPDPGHDGFGFVATLVAESTIHFEWNSIPGASYVIQSSPALGQPFEDLGNPGLPATATTTRTAFELPIDLATSARFYRLRAN